MTYSQLKTKQREIVCLERNLFRIIETMHFQRAYETASETQRAIVIEHFQRKEKNKIEAWIREIMLDEMGSWTLRQLRERARELFVPYASRLSKGELLREILIYEQVRADLKDREAASSHAPALAGGETH